MPLPKISCHQKQFMNIKKSRTGIKSSYPEHVISAACQDILSGNLSYTEAMGKYRVRSAPTIYRWVARYQKQYGSNLEAMKQSHKAVIDSKKDCAVDQLHLQIKQLKAALELAKLENLALNTMIDIADEQLNTGIRKKSAAKQ